MSTEPPVAPPPTSYGQSFEQAPPSRAQIAALGALVAFGCGGLAGFINNISSRIEFDRLNVFESVSGAAQLLGSLGLAVGGALALYVVLSYQKSLGLVAASITGVSAVLIFVTTIDQLLDVSDFNGQTTQYVFIATSFISQIAAGAAALVVLLSKD